MEEQNEQLSISEWFEKGRQCFHQPDGVMAVKAFEHVIDLTPAYQHTDGDNPYFYLGKIHEMEDRLDEAIINYTRALAINPYDEESLIGRGSCYTVTQNHSQAVADFTKVLDLPDNQRNVPKKHLFYVLSENYRKMKEWGLATFWSKKALEADPGNQRHQELFKELSKKTKD